MATAETESGAEIATRVEDEFRTEMKRLRLAAGLSQADLANRLSARGLKFHQQTIMKMETGQRQVRLGEAYVLALEIGVSLLVTASLSSTAVYERGFTDGVSASRAALDALGVS